MLIRLINIDKFVNYSKCANYTNYSNYCSISSIFFVVSWEPLRKLAVLAAFLAVFCASCQELEIAGNHNPRAPRACLSISVRGFSALSSCTIFLRKTSASSRSLRCSFACQDQNRRIVELFELFNMFNDFKTLKTLNALKTWRPTLAGALVSSLAFARISIVSICLLHLLFPHSPHWRHWYNYTLAALAVSSLLL